MAKQRDKTGEGNADREIAEVGSDVLERSWEMRVKKVMGKDTGRRVALGDIVGVPTTD
jgi:hypothetical protein